MGRQLHPVRLHPLHFLIYPASLSTRLSLQPELTTDPEGVEAVRNLQGNYVMMRKLNKMHTVPRPPRRSRRSTARRRQEDREDHRAQAYLKMIP